MMMRNTLYCTDEKRIDWWCRLRLRFTSHNKKRKKNISKYITAR